jgi:hypothetical protein
METEMKRWQLMVDSITAHAEGDDPALQARAKVIKNLIGNRIQDWANCDKGHTSYLDAHYQVLRKSNQGGPQMDIPISKLA